MDRPNDYRGRIGAADDRERSYLTTDSRKNEYEEFSKKDDYRKVEKRFSHERQTPKFSRDERSDREKNRYSLKIYHKDIKTCTVNDYTVRDGFFHEYENFYAFVKKLLESVNISLSSKMSKGSYVSKKLSELVSPTSIEEQTHFAGRTRFPHEVLQCHMVVLGLPRSIFVGNGFGNQRQGNSVYAAAKDLVDKMQRIGFVSPKLYEVIGKHRVFDASRKLPDFSKAIDCFISLEKCLFDSRGKLTSHWPNDLLDALDQPPYIFDSLNDTFKKIIRGTDKNHERDGYEKSTNGADDDIERKIALQREELLRRERAREMIEPLDFGSHSMSVSTATAAGLPQMPWNATVGIQANMAYRGPYASTLPISSVMASMIPPVGIVNPLDSRGSRKDIQKAVDMDIEEHVYHDSSHFKRTMKVDRERESEARRREEENRLKRKEEELNRKMKEEDERRKRDIEKEVRRRLEEELEKRNLNAIRHSFPPSIPHGSYSPRSSYQLEGYTETSAMGTLNPSMEHFDHEMEEIRRLVKETENRLRSLAEGFDNGSNSTTLRTLAALGETASGMSGIQRRDLISELKNILGQSSATASNFSSRHLEDDRSSSYPAVTYDGKRSTIPFNSRSSRDFKDVEYSRRRSRSRSPYTRNNSSPRSRSKVLPWEKEEDTKFRRSDNGHYHRDALESSNSRSNEQCAFCNSGGHPSDFCNSYSSPTLRKLQTRRMGFCQLCLKKHSGRCDSSPCDYCGYSDHHRAICDHQNATRTRELVTLRACAKPT